MSAFSRLKQGDFFTLRLYKLYGENLFKKNYRAVKSLCIFIFSHGASRHGLFNIIDVTFFFVNLLAACLCHG